MVQMYRSRREWIHTSYQIFQTKSNKFLFQGESLQKWFFFLPLTCVGMVQLEPLHTTTQTVQTLMMLTSGSNEQLKQNLLTKLYFTMKIQGHLHALLPQMVPRENTVWRKASFIKPYIKFWVKWSKSRFKCVYLPSCQWFDFLSWFLLRERNRSVPKDKSLAKMYTLPIRALWFNRGVRSDESSLKNTPKERSFPPQ